MLSKLFILSISLILLWSCNGNGTVSGTVSGEYSNKHESNSSYSYTEKVNGDTVKEVNSKSHSSGGSEGEFGVVIGNGDTAYTADEMPTLKPKITCTEALNREDFEKVKTLITKTMMDKNRLIAAKVAINDCCLESNQVRDALELFTMDKYRLDFAKFAYGHVTDRVNYHRIREAFTFEDSKKKLDNYINTI